VSVWYLGGRLEADGWLVGWWKEGCMSNWEGLHESLELWSLVYLHLIISGVRVIYLSLFPIFSRTIL
jgi:hypothetical protein